MLESKLRQKILPPRTRLLPIISYQLLALKLLQEMMQETNREMLQETLQEMLRETLQEMLLDFVNLWYFVPTLLQK